MFANLINGSFTVADEFWKAEPLQVRIDTLRRGRPRIAWLYEKPDTSTFRYRCFNPATSLAAAQLDIGAAWFALAEMPKVLDVIGKLDTLIVCRVRYNAEVARLIARAIAQGTRILFDCDDLVFDSRYVHLVIKTLDQPDDDAAHWDFWHATIGRIEATARLCHGGIATNAFLAERLGRVIGDATCAIVPNYLARDQETISRQLFETKRKRGFAGTGPITIGYFSGTPTHNNDFAIAAPALARLLSNDSKTRLRIVGFPPPNGPLAAFTDRIETIPLQDYLNLQRVIAEVEINIAPLQNNEFSNCKSELKFFEAAAVGTWTIASPTYTFQQSIEDGVTGRLARAHEWDQALAEAVELVRDPERYTPMAEAAAAACYERYGWNNQLGCILRAVGVNDLNTSSQSPMSSTRLGLRPINSRLIKG
jgi:glycosyltransferase involved in cell wall biosynthesis